MAEIYSWDKTLEDKKNMRENFYNSTGDVISTTTI